MTKPHKGHKHQKFFVLMTADGPGGFGPGGHGPGGHDHGHDHGPGGPGGPGRGRRRNRRYMAGGREGGFPGFLGRGPRAGRGDVRAAILALLSEEPMHGYQIMRELGERSGGVWRPSPGSIYPTLQQLEDEELVRPETGDGGRRVFTLTDAGREAQAGAAGGPAPWDAVGVEGDTTALELRDLVARSWAPRARSCTPASPRRSRRPRTCCATRAATSTGSSPRTPRRQASPRQK